MLKLGLLRQGLEFFRRVLTMVEIKSRGSSASKSKTRDIKSSASKKKLEIFFRGN
jgi:hypothetical protein